MNVGIYNNKNAFSGIANKPADCAKLVINEKTVRVQKRDSVDFSREALESMVKAGKSSRAARSVISKFAAEAEENPSVSAEDVESAVENAIEKIEDKIEEQIESVTSGDSEKSGQKTLAEMVKEQMDKIDGMFSDNNYDKSKDSKLMSIKGKIYRGLYLSPAEQQYLSQKDPDSYSTFQTINSTRKMFSCSLRSCRTRDDLIAMRLSNSLTALSEFRKAVRKGDGSAIAGLNAALENEIKSYARTREYQSLPTVAECNKFDRELAKAKRYECEKRREEMKARVDKKYKKKSKNVGDGKRTVAQVMASPLARKVLASRRSSGSCSCGSMGFSLSEKYKF
ncbi:MAG: hypothetical protein J1F04_04375 [Oscillospiraceae bacterium]|nr:hypothetical protein [Oscillospiraceae bacterium]